MTGTFDGFKKKILENIEKLKDKKKEDIDLTRRAAQQSLTLATDAFGDGIEFVRGGVELKAQADQDKLMDMCTDARTIISYQLNQKKDNLWRSISYLTKKLYADERPDYNHKIKTQILEKFKEFKDVIVEATNQINESQKTKWIEYQTQIADYYKFYDTKIIGAKQSLFDVAQGLLTKKVKLLLQNEDEAVTTKFDEYEMKVFKQLHTHRETMTALYNNAIQSIDKIEDRYLTTPLIEILNGHKEEADYQFDVAEDKFLDDFVVVREWWTTHLEDELDRFEEHVVAEAQKCDERVAKEKTELVQKTTQMKEEMEIFFEDEKKAFQEMIDGHIDRFKWLLTKYGMDARLPSEDQLDQISPDPFTGELNEEDAAEHQRQHENWEPHSHGDHGVYPDLNDPLANLPGKPTIPRGEGLQPHIENNEEKDVDEPVHGTQHEHTTPGLNQVEEPNPVQIKEEVDEIYSGAAAQKEYGINDEELRKKIEATVEFFLGKLPSRSGELIAGLQTRRQELALLTAHVREGLTEALEQEFAQAWATLGAFQEKLNEALTERDFAALDAVNEAVNEFLGDVHDLRESIVYGIQELQGKLEVADYDTQHKINELVASEKERFEAGVEEALVNLETLIADMQVAQDTAFENARQALATALSGKRTAFHNSLTRDAAAFNDALAHNYNAFVEAVNAQRAAFENSLAEKQAAFDAAKARKLKQIHFVHDSNYKFHLIKTLEAKAAAITEALAQARQGFSDALQAETEAFQAFRDGERTAFDEARQSLRDRFAEAEVAAEQALNATIEENNKNFDDKLAEFAQQLADGLNDQREQFKAALVEEAHYEEEYTYTEHEAPTANYSPYSHSSHSQFLSQFHYYLSDQLKKLDAGIDGVAEWTQKEVDAATEAFLTAVGYSEQRLGDQAQAAQEALAQLADALATEYAEAQDLELAAVQEKRAGLEEAIAAKAEELKKKIVYLKKQLHYKGGYDAHGEYKLGEAIEALVGEFDHAVAEIRAWFANNVETEAGESTARANAVGEAFQEATGRLMEIQAALSAELAQAARDGAVATEEQFVTTSQERLDAFQYVIHALAEKVQQWYEEKQAWIGGLHDEYYAQDLRAKLDAKREQALAALADRASAAAEVVHYRREELSARLGELVGRFDNSANQALQSLADSSAAESASLAGDVHATAEGFAAAAAFEANGINAFLDDLVQQWVWWLRQYYGYAGYDAHYYENQPAGEGHPAAPDVHVHSGAAPSHDAAHDPAYDESTPHAYDPHTLAGYDEVEAFFQRDFIGDLPQVAAQLLADTDVAAGLLEQWFAQFEDEQEGALEARRSDLQARLVAAREGIERGLAEAQDAAKANIAAARDSFIADVADKRGAVESAIAQLKEAHYGHGGDDEKRALLHEIHGAKEAFATAVQDARSEFDEVLAVARDASEARLAAAREQFEADVTRKRADLDAAVNGLRTQLADQAAAKRDSLAVALKATWEDLEEAIAETAAHFSHAVEAKLAWINKVHYYGLRQDLLNKVNDLRAAWTAEVTGLRQTFADSAEERRLAADDAIARDQDDFEAFVVGVLATCDGNRVTESAALEAAITARRTSFDELLGYCREAIETAIKDEIAGLKDFLQSQYGYAGHAPGPYKRAPEPGYYEADYADAVAEYVNHVTHPQADQASAAIAWLGKRREVLEHNIAGTEDALEAAQLERADWEANGFGEEANAVMEANGALAATLLQDIRDKNDAVQATLDGLKHEHYGHVDAHGYRYKLLHQLHHQRVAFEQAVEAAWVTWTQSRDLALETAGATAVAAADSFEGFLAARLGEWEGAAAGVRQALAGQLAEKGEALKGAVQQATKVFQEKQAHKRHYISELDDPHKQEALTHKVDLEDQLYQERVKEIWAGFGNEGRSALEWLDGFLDSEGGDLAGAQEVAGDQLADALGAELDRLAEALGTIGDAFFQAKHDETERLLHALSHYGYGDYQAGYEPVFKHEDEEVEDPHPQVVEDDIPEEHVSYYEPEEPEVVETPEEPEPVTETVPAEPEPEVYYEPYVEPVVEPEVPEPEPVVEPAEPEPIYEPESEYHYEESESESSYISYETTSHYSSHSSESSSDDDYYYSRYHHDDHGHGHGGHGGHAHHNYDEVTPYKPSGNNYHPPAHQVAADYSNVPDNVDINVNNESIDGDGCEADVVINIFNGVGAPSVGRKLEYGCQPSHG